MAYYFQHSCQYTHNYWVKTIAFVSICNLDIRFTVEAGGFCLCERNLYWVVDKISCRQVE
jgi:hypothetical protein